MSTRGSWGFRKDGNLTLGYKHGDAYPEWTGTLMLGYARTHTVEQMEVTLAKLKLVGMDYVPTPEEIASHRHLADLQVSEQSLEDVYCLIREAQGDLSAYDRDGVFLFIDSSDWIYHDEVWDWVLDLDAEVLEVSHGGAVVKTYPLGDLPTDDEMFEEVGRY